MCHTNILSFICLGKHALSCEKRGRGTYLRGTGQKPLFIVIMLLYSLFQKTVECKECILISQVLTCKIVIITISLQLDLVSTTVYNHALASTVYLVRVYIYIYICAQNPKTYSPKTQTIRNCWISCLHAGILYMHIFLNPKTRSFHPSKP